MHARVRRENGTWQIRHADFACKSLESVE